MVFSYEQTKVLILFILTTQKENARAALRKQLNDLNCKEPNFYASVIKHGQGIPLTSEQWLDFLSKIPTSLLR
jgi:hypothetical protein